jgi:hypothetical protein
MNNGWKDNCQCAYDMHERYFMKCSLSRYSPSKVPPWLVAHAINDWKLTNKKQKLDGVLKDTLPTKSHMSRQLIHFGARKQFINSIIWVTNSFHFNSRLRFQLQFPIEKLLRWHLFNLIIFPQSFFFLLCFCNYCHSTIGLSWN